MRNGWIALVLGGCDFGASTLAEGFEQELTETRGCGDLHAYAFDSEDEVMLGVILDGPLAAADGEDTHTVVTLPDPSIVVKVEVGSKISDAACDDVIENGGPRVSETWEAVSGTVTLDLASDDHTTLADLLLEDVTFESETGEQVTVEVFTFEALSVGWLPG